jgi:Domain of unknown function (DUF4159)
MKRVVVVLVLAASASALAQRPFDRAQFGAQGRRFGGIPVMPNPKYDGQFTFARLRWGPELRVISQSVPWSHDYPDGERHFMQIVNEITLVRPKLTETSIVGFDDPTLFRYPIVYMAEPGYLQLTEEEAATFRAYLEKGGFVIFDDFAESRGGWYPFASEMQRVIPGARWVELDGRHEIFHSFFEIDRPLDLIPPYDQQYKPIYYGLFEGNDPARRLMAIANFNNDISEYWEFAPTGIMPVFNTNEAYKLGVNYIMYGLTH